MAGQYSFTIDQGITFSKTVTWKDESGTPVNMTGMTARAAIRTRDGDPIATVTCSVTPLAGEIVLSLTHEQTAALDFDTAVYDVDVLKDDVPFKRLLRGTVTLCKDVLDA